MQIPMLFRFSAYGFLKNQQYYDPFLILAFREKGLSFFVIGLLIGFRELAVNVMEVPTGVIADLFGRRRSMILSLSSYIMSFVVFGLSSVVWHLFAAMFFFAIGEAFRTGTHKAMILDWLRLQGRQDEKTKTYGFTRSWSKIGSAVSVLIATGIVLATGEDDRPQYSYVFLFCIIPYVLGIINFLGYPAELDGRPEGRPTVGRVFRELWRAFATAFGHRRLRRVLLESMSYEGTFKVTKGYLQPVVRQMALALPLFTALAGYRRTAILIGCFYFALYIASAAASRKASLFAERFGSEDRAARALWLVTAMVFLPIAAALWFEVYWLAALGFIPLALLQNFWRPITITRVDNETDARMGATMLSIESQAKALGTMTLAPLLGYAVDALAGEPGQPALWAVGAAGLAITLVGSLLPAAARPAD
jgi:MFS family permease